MMLAKLTRGPCFTGILPYFTLFSLFYGPIYPMFQGTMGSSGPNHGTMTGIFTCFSTKQVKYHCFSTKQWYLPLNTTVLPLFEVNTAVLPEIEVFYL